MNILYQLNDIMQKMNIKYAICGGWAIDLFIGQKTRPHKDLDVAVFGDDRDKIVHYMLKSGWLVFEPCGCEYLHRINAVDNQLKIKTNIWCVKPYNNHYKFREFEKDMFSVEHDGTEQTELDFIEFLFNEHKNGYFLYARNHDIKRDMNKAILGSDGILYLAPELVLLYKSTNLRNPDYQYDYENTLPLLDEDSKKWLKNALDTVFDKQHEWSIRIKQY